MTSRFVVPTYHRLLTVVCLYAFWGMGGARMHAVFLSIRKVLQDEEKLFVSYRILFFVVVKF